MLEIRREDLALFLPVRGSTPGTGQSLLKRQEIEAMLEVLVTDARLPMENTIKHLLFDFS